MTARFPRLRVWPTRAPLGDLVRFVIDPGRYLTSLPARGDLVRVRLGYWAGYVVCDPGLTQIILLDDSTFAKGGPLLDKAKDIIGDGLITAPRHLHRRPRRLLQPAFHRSRVQGYATTMTEQAAAVVDCWKGRDTVDVVAEMNSISTHVVLRTLFSRRVKETAMKALVGDIKEFSEGLFLAMLVPTRLATWPWPGLHGFRAVRDRLREFTRGLVAEGRDGEAIPDDMLSLLLTARDAGAGMTDDEIVDHVINFVVAGIETTSNVLAWALHLVASHPQVEQRLHNEVDEVLGGRPAEYGDVAKLHLTGRVITETLRLYPPTWLITRCVTKEVELGRVRLAAGATVIYSPYLLHRHPSLYPDPDVFDPDRWTRREVSDLPRGAYVPFGGGPRKCIGEVFGMTEAILVLATTVARWRLVPVRPRTVRPALQATLTPKSLIMRPVPRSP